MRGLNILMRVTGGILTKAGSQQEGMARVLAKEKTEGIQPKDGERDSEIPSRHSQGNHACIATGITYPSFVQERPYHLRVR